MKVGDLVIYDKWRSNIFNIYEITEIYEDKAFLKYYLRRTQGSLETNLDNLKLATPEHIAEVIAYKLGKEDDI